MITGLGFVCFAILVVGGSLVLTGLMTLLAMRQVARAEMTTHKARLERANRRFWSDLEQYPHDATVPEIAAREAIITEAPIGAMQMVGIGEGD